MLAYVFWHRPRAHVAPDHYERALRAFHEALRAEPPAGLHGSLAVRLDQAPWLAGAEEGPAFEDWYLTEDWAAIGRLGDAALQGARRAPHDAAAAIAGRGAAGVYRRMLGAPHPAGASATWFDKPPGTSYDDFGERLNPVLHGADPGAQADVTLWQRQLVLGPAPEFCLLADAPVGLGGLRSLHVARTRVA